MASNQDLTAWAQAGESETQEFKIRTSSGCLREGGETLCSFLNTRGGRVLFGVENDGTVVGQEVTDATLRDITDEIQRIDPSIAANVERIAAGETAVAAAAVERGTRRPYTYRGKAYKRVGTTTSEMSRDEYNEMLLESLHSTSRWENQEASGWSVDDLDVDELRSAVAEAVRRGRIADPGTSDPSELLRGLGLMRDTELLRAAVVLFARADRVLPDYPQCRLKLARFKGRDKSEFLDNRQYEDNAFALLRAADTFLRQHLPVAGRIVPNLFQRQDDPIYPPEALREALANAFCHRDYAIGGGSVGVAIFDDRLEITSSGELHFGLSVDDLYRSHESLLWNPAIASVFYKRGFIETWGRGTLKMAELTQSAGLPKPEFEEPPGAVLVRFRPSRYLPPQRIGRDLTDVQRQILAVIADEGRSSLMAIHEGLGGKVARRSLQGDLQFLKSLDLIESSGWGRGARWHLKDDSEMLSD